MIGPAASGSVTAWPPAGRRPRGSDRRGARQERAGLPLVLQADPEQQDAERDAAPTQAEDPQADRRPGQPHRTRRRPPPRRRSAPTRGAPPPPGAAAPRRRTPGGAT